MEIGKINAFADNTRKLSTDYDFNKDGTVDIQDYNFALLSLEDDDVDNDVELSKDELEVVFKDLISEDNKVNPDNVNVTQDNVTKLSQKVVADGAEKIVDPTTAKTFEELQEIGKNLSKIIKRCTKLLPFLNKQMELYNKELEKISKEKAEKEKEYEAASDKVEQKNALLSEKMAEVMSRQETATQEMKNNTRKIISDTITRYKNGEFEGQDLYSVITKNIANDSSGSFSAAELNSLVSDCGSLGEEIKTLCGDVENIVADIRNVTQRFNNVTGTLNALKDSRNGVIDTSSKASAEYQKGYQKRLDLRQEISSKYGTGTAGLKAFLKSQESNTIPFGDAYSIMAEIAKGTGISFKDGNIIMPNFIYMESESEITDEERAQMKEFNAISDIINQKYGSNNNSSNPLAKTGDTEEADGADEVDDASEVDEPEDVDDDGQVNPDEEDVDVDDEELDDDEFNTGEPTCLGTCTKSECCDPISFKQGDTSFHFVSDRDKDQIFDGASEFLGAKNGWEEMKAYDKNGDGKVNGAELEDLKLVAMNDTSGKYTFQSAAEAGIAEIDLNSYQKQDSKQVDGDMLRGTFSLIMNDGSVIQGEQTDDTAKNIENRYSTLFGANIMDLTETYEANPFMDDFQEKIDTTLIKNSNESAHSGLKQDVANSLQNTQSTVDSEAKTSANKAVSQYNAEKKKEEQEQEKINNKNFFMD